jgi:hypothetical protein
MRQVNSSQVVQLFDITPAYRMRVARFRGAPVAARGGANPPAGAVINYYAKDVNDSTKASISIYDAAGKLVKTFTRDAKDEADRMDLANGMNQFNWNLQYPGGERIDNMVLWNGVPGNIFASSGTYTARLRVGKDSVTKTFVVKPDPNYKVSEQQYKDQFDFLVTVRDKFNDVQKTIRDIRLLRTQINDFVARQDKSNVKEVKAMGDSINKKLTAIEETLYQTKAKSSQDVLNYPIRLNDKLAGVFNAANSGNSPPSRQARDVYNELAAQVDAELAKFRKIQDEDVSRLNQLIREKTLPAIGLKPEEKKH